MDRELLPLEERVITAMVFPMGLLVTSEVSDLIRRDAEISTAEDTPKPMAEYRD